MRNVLNSPRLLEFKKKKQRIFLNKILFILASLFVIIVGLSFLSRIAKLNISGVEITGNKVVDGEMIKEVVDTDLGGYYLWFFPKTNIFFYPKNKIKDNLTDKFKRLKDISFKITEARTLEISLIEREALYTWCGAEPSLQDSERAEEGSEKCYFLDETGYIFDEAPYFSGEVYFKFYGPTDGNFEKLILFKKALENMGLKTVALHTLENGDIKLFLSGKTLATKPEIIFKADSDLEIIAENLETALTTEPLQSNFKNKYASLLYIDLRYGNKVFYKFK